MYISFHFQNIYVNALVAVVVYIAGAVSYIGRDKKEKKEIEKEQKVNVFFTLAVG
jgi:hypothetical protein